MKGEFVDMSISVTLSCRKWLEHTRGIEPAAPAWLTETRVTTKWSEDEREPSFTLECTQYLNSHRLDANAEPLRAIIACIFFNPFFTAVYDQEQLLLQTIYVLNKKSLL